MKRDEYKEYLFFKGEDTRAYEYFGVSLDKRGDEFIYTFRVFAGRAEEVRLISDFTNWEEGLIMDKECEGGIFSVEVVTEKTLEGSLYKYLIKNGDKILKKGDPYARRSLGFDDGASVISLDDSFKFTDSGYLRERKRKFGKKRGYYLPIPVNVYELHPESFLRKEDGKPLGFSELSKILPGYLKSMGYTHLELMPITEYPYGGSWGYQVGAFFAPTVRLGTPEELKAFVNELHGEGIGVILDFVPAHFPRDEWGLFEFDGTPTYEYKNPSGMDSPSWGTRYFDLGRGEVRSFLISAALFYLREYHFDGLRVDAVSAMIYLDHDKVEGEWEKSEDGSNLSREGIAFLRELNSKVFSEFSDLLMIAEESRAEVGVTTPVSEGGLGFNLKWNMGFANDLFDYISIDPIYRSYKHSALTFPISYAFKENYILPISHDEIVHGKKSFIDKAFGSYEDKFKTARLAYLTFMTYPGKKHLFMGTELAQFREWDHEGEIEWFMLGYKAHEDFREYVRALNYFYLAHPELYEIDFSPDGFSWIECDNSSSSTVSFIRRSVNRSALTVALNFSGAEQKVYIGNDSDYVVVFSSSPGNEAEIFTEDGRSYIRLAELSGVILKRKSREVRIKIK